MARVKLGESKLRARRRRKKLVTVMIGAGAFLFFVGGMVWLSWAPFFRVNTISVSGMQTLSSSTIAQFIKEGISGSYAYLFAKDNIFLYPKDALSAQLVQAIPTIARVEVGASNFNTLEVKVVEREPKALWCGSQPGGNECLLLDPDGVAYVSSPTFSGSIYKKYYGELVSSSTPKQYLTPALFRSLSALADTLAQHQKDNAITYIEVDKNQDAKVHFANRFVLIFSLLDEGGDIYERFILGLEAEPFKTHELSEFEYLDLRFGDKLYYKLK